MANFLVGDELGNIKCVQYIPGAEPSTNLSILYAAEQPSAVQALGLAPQALNPLVAAAYANGDAAIFTLSEANQSANECTRWTETRIKPGQRYIGLAVRERAIYTSTSNGALRLTTLNTDNEIQETSLAALPTRLKDWRLSDDGTTFAYGGDEVDLSVWDTTAAFSSKYEGPEGAGAKRKRKDELMPGESWRAKNVPNDNLGLRQPVRVTSLAYLKPSDSPSQLIAGTELGELRHYDTRAGGRPIANYNGVGKVGGIKHVRAGLSDHQAFVSDYGGNLSCIDMRNGRIAYSYKGISAAVSSVASASPEFLASTAMDRYVRIHSTFPVPSKLGDQQEQKGEVLAKIYTTAVPTVVIRNPTLSRQHTTEERDNDGDDDDDIWEKMEHIGDESDEEHHRKKRRSS